MHDSSLNFTFPFQKINKEQRIVTGIATADNLDLEGDVVNFDASVEAFSNWIGNIREMHSPIAVGKMVDWKPVPVMHNGREYQGIEVSVYISKGAESTWQKILDGTLRGFSIGGNITKAENRYLEDIKKSVREIIRYSLGELSVVDNPCNPAGMFAMIKSVNGHLEYVAELNDVFYCEDDKYAAVGGESSCPACSEEMLVIGKAESFDQAEINKFIKDFEDKFEKALSDINTVPTDAMASEARRGLEWRREFNRGGTAVGVARARDIMNKDRLSISTVRRMHSYFSRHEVDKQGKGFSPGEEGYPSAGRIAWALWGGDPGQSWARAITRRIESMEKAEGYFEFIKAAPKAGDFVSWNSSGGRARGMVIRVATTGSVDVPDTDLSIAAAEDDPALLIRIWRETADGWRATDTVVGHKSSTVTMIDDLDKVIDTASIGEGGGGIVNPAQGLPEEIGKRIVERGGEYCVESEDGSRSFGCYSSRSAAEQRLAQVENFSKSFKYNDFSKAVTKREDGEDFPAAAFAYVPDPESPSTWKLRLWDSLDERETRAQVGRAVAALGPGGFRGNRVQIPAADLPSVKAKVRAAWRRVNNSDAEMPEILKSDDMIHYEDNFEKGGKNNMDLQENEINDNINTMSDDFSDDQKQTILSKLSDFLFGKAEKIDKAQTIEVNTVNGNFRIVTDGSLENPPQVVLNMNGQEEKSMHAGEMEDEEVMKSEDSSGEDISEDAELEKSEATDNEGDEEMDFEKVLEGLSALLDEKLEKVKADITSEVDGKIEAIEKSVSEVKESAEDLSESIEKVANSGAEKKSEDSDVVEEEVLEKSAPSESFWGGVFVPVEIAKTLGYES